MWRKAVMAHFEILYQDLSEAHKETTKELYQDSYPLRRKYNPRTREYGR
jgi:hypothetical protein